MNQRAMAQQLLRNKQPMLPAAIPNAVGWVLGTASARALADYYLTTRGADLMMPRSRFNPADIKRILPRVFLLELRSEKEIRVRLAGTKLTARLGRDLAGLNWLDLITPEQRAARAEAYGQMVMGQTAIRSVLRYPSTTGEHMVVECLTLPLTPTHSDEPPIGLGVAASLWRPAGAKPLPFLQGHEEITLLSLPAPALH